MLVRPFLFCSGFDDQFLERHHRRQALMLKAAFTGGRHPPSTRRAFSGARATKVNLFGRVRAVVCSSCREISGLVGGDSSRHICQWRIRRPLNNQRGRRRPQVSTQAEGRETDAQRNYLWPKSGEPAEPARARFAEAAAPKATPSFSNELFTAFDAVIGRGHSVRAVSVVRLYAMPKVAP